MGEYRTALICEAGHVITDSLETSPEMESPRCHQCGGKTFKACPSCTAPVRGYHHVPGVVYPHNYVPPDCCHECGTAYPWARQQANDGRPAMDDRQAFVEQEKGLRRRALELFYDQWREVGGTRSTTAIKFGEVMAALGMSRQITSRVLDHLWKRRFLRLVADQDLFEISDEGIGVIESDRLDEVLPPPVVNVSVMSAGRDLCMSGVVQQGQVPSAAQWADAARVIPDLRRAIQDHVEDHKVRDRAIEDLDEIAEEVGKQRPDARRATIALKRLLSAVQVSAAAKTLYPLVRSLAQHLGFSLPELP